MFGMSISINEYSIIIITIMITIIINKQLSKQKKHLVRCTYVGQTSSKIIRIVTLKGISVHLEYPITLILTKLFLLKTR